MNPLKVFVLGVCVLTASGAAFGASVVSENFESYGAGATIAGSNGWQEIGRGDWFEAQATGPGDPSFLGTRYGDLSNNGNGTEDTSSWLNKSFTKQTAGVVIMDFDVLFELGGILNSCNIYLADGDKTPGEINYAEIAAAINMGAAGLRVRNEGGWRAVDNISIVNDAWYHFSVQVDLDAQNWQLQVAAYTGEVLGAAVLASYGGTSTFDFRNSSVDDLGLAEFMVHGNIMDDSRAEGFLLDNIHTPEPAGITLLAVAGLGLLARRKRAA